MGGHAYRHEGCDRAGKVARGTLNSPSSIEEYPQKNMYQPGSTNIATEGRVVARPFAFVRRIEVDRIRAGQRSLSCREILLQNYKIKKLSHAMYNRFCLNAAFPVRLQRGDKGAGRRRPRLVGNKYCKS